MTFDPQDALFNSLLDDPYLSLQLGGKPSQQVSGEVVASSRGVWPPDLTTPDMSPDSPDLTL